MHSLQRPFQLQSVRDQVRSVFMLSNRKASFLFTQLKSGGCYFVLNFKISASPSIAKFSSCVVTDIVSNVLLFLF